MTPRAFLFDIGNVLVRLDFPTAMRRLSERSQATEAEVPLLLATLRDEHERGLVSDGEFVSKSMKLIGFRGSEAEFSHIWCDIFTENRPMLETVRRLAGNHRLLHFSNTNGLHLAWLGEKFDFGPLFEGGSYSHLVGEMKPRDGIYHHALETFRLDPAQTFYVDDLLPNIAAGQRFGLNCHHYSPDEHGAFEKALGLWLS